jgi:ribokinase
MSDVVVFGSANADLVLRVLRIPGPGETVLATASERVPGGKGANQAVAAARSGAATAFIGAVGPDPEGALLAAALTGAGVDVARLRRSGGPSGSSGSSGSSEPAAPTGLAVVIVGADAENSIVVASGANATLDALTDADRTVIGAARVLLCQLEVPISGVVAATAEARARGVTVILNAAPSQPLPDQLWAAIDLLVVNQHEAVDLLGGSPTGDSPATTPERALDALLRRVPAVLITLGAAGARYADRAGTRIDITAPTVEAVDTTAAGDTFCGVLAGGVAAGRSMTEALQRAAAAAALCVQRPGAVPAIPAADEIDALWQATYGGR